MPMRPSLFNSSIGKVVCDAMSGCCLGDVDVVRAASSNEKKAPRDENVDLGGLEATQL